MHGCSSWSALDNGAQPANTSTTLDSGTSLAVYNESWTAAGNPHLLNADHSKPRHLRGTRHFHSAGTRAAHVSTGLTVSGNPHDTSAPTVRHVPPRGTGLYHCHQL